MLSKFVTPWVLHSSFWGLKVVVFFHEARMTEVRVDGGGARGGGRWATRLATRKPVAGSGGGGGGRGGVTTIASRRRKTSMGVESGCVVHATHDWSHCNLSKKIVINSIRRS